MSAIPWHVADSPFYTAYWQLFVDGALRNRTVFGALGDGGSGNSRQRHDQRQINVTSPYGILVGGTSLSTLTTAEADATLVAIVRPRWRATGPRSGSWWPVG